MGNRHMECNSNPTLKERYKDAKPYEDPSAEIHSRAIFDFNKMLRGGQMKPLDCYRWLDKKRQQQEDDFAKAHGFRMDFSFNYLYPEVIGPMPDTYEEWKEELKKYSPKNEGKNRQKYVEEYGEDRVKEVEEILTEMLGEEYKF